MPVAVVLSVIAAILGVLAGDVSRAIFRFAFAGFIVVAIVVLAVGDRRRNRG